MTDTTQFGVHLMFDGYNAPESLLADVEALTQLLHDLPNIMKMEKISEPLVLELDKQNEKDPGGCSGFVMIAESHISFHTFPKRGFVTADVYTCQNDLNVEQMTTALKEVFGTEHEDVTMIPRGTKYPEGNIYDQ